MANGEWLMNGMDMMADYNNYDWNNTTAKNLDLFFVFFLGEERKHFEWKSKREEKTFFFNLQQCISMGNDDKFFFSFSLFYSLTIDYIV